MCDVKRHALCDICIHKRTCVVVPNNWTVTIHTSSESFFLFSTHNYHHKYHHHHYIHHYHLHHQQQHHHRRQHHHNHRRRSRSRLRNNKNHHHQHQQRRRRHRHHHLWNQRSFVCQHQHKNKVISMWKIIIIIIIIIITTNNNNNINISIIITTIIIIIYPVLSLVLHFQSVTYTVQQSVKSHSASDDSESNIYICINCFIADLFRIPLIPGICSHTCLLTVNITSTRTLTSCIPMTLHVSRISHHLTQHLRENTRFSIRMTTCTWMKELMQYVYHIFYFKATISDFVLL